MGNSVCSCSGSQNQTDFNLSHKVNEDFYLPKRDNTSEKKEKLKQPKFVIEIENDDPLKAKNADKLVENENNIETRVHTDSLSNGSNFYKNKEGYIKIIQSAFRRFIKKKFYLKERNKLNFNLKEEHNLDDNNIEEKQNHYMRKSLQENSEIFFSNNSSSYLSEKDDSKDRVIFPKRKTDAYKVFKYDNTMENKNLGDIITLLKYCSINKHSFSLEDIKNKISNRIFAKKSYEDGSSYYGFLDETKNEITLYAIYKDIEGRKLMGEFNGSSFNGYGVFNLNGAKYEGEWEKNYKTHIGIENWPDGSYYQGSFKNGKKDGIGFYKWPNEIIYQGEWLENRIEGFGIINYPNGDIYWGEFKNGTFDGYGEFSWKDGRFYKGFFMGDKKNGIGLFKYAYQDKYFFGFFRDNIKEGIGCIIQKNIVKYGLWSGGQKRRSFANKSEAVRFVSKDQAVFIKFFIDSKLDLKNSLFF